MQQKKRLLITTASDDHPTELVLQYTHYYHSQQFYSGGICWINVQDEKVADQLLEFAKSKLSLKLPKNEDFQKQINYCWSYWKEGDVLLVFDNVNDYQQIKTYLPPNEQRFHVLVTTPLESLGEFLDKSFDLLHSKVRVLKDELEDKLGSAPEKDEQALPNYFFYTLIIYLLICLVISISSLTASYNLFSSEAWTNVYDEQGWIIELVRSLFILIGTAFLIGVIFSRETCEFLNW